MLFHNLRIAWKSLKRNRILSVLIVAGIALGIAVSTTFATVRHSFAKDPVPGKSNGVLYYGSASSWSAGLGTDGAFVILRGAATKNLLMESRDRADSSLRSE